MDSPKEPQPLSPPFSPGAREGARGTVAADPRPVQGFGVQDFPGPGTSASSAPAVLARFRMPAEWEPHAATWLSWPRPESDSFPGAHYEAAAPVFAALIREIAAGEEVHLNVWDEAAWADAREYLKAAKAPLNRVHPHLFPAYEPWCRDHGPVFVVQDGPPRERAVLDWGYNAWGGKYPPFDLDNEVPRKVAGFRRLPVHTPGIILEGGSIEVNGRGTLITTEACLLHPNRNPHLNRAEIEQALKGWLGVTQVLWLGDGIVGDDTDGHVDDITRFAGPRTIVTAVEEDAAAPNHAPLADNLERLLAARTPGGDPFRIVTVPMPGAVTQKDQRLPASYLNFYVANAAVIVPTYRHANDAIALAKLQELFTDRPVVGIDATDMIWGLGAFHCITQQEPA